jgi:phage protein D
MIFKSAFPNSPTVNMVIDGVDVDYTAINSITITSAENEHDYAELHVSGLIPKFITEYINRPVYLNIEYSPTQRTSFHGYVAFVEPKAVTRRGLINKSPIQSAVISCLGASYDMKAKKTKLWEQVTIKQVVTAIANTYNYSCQVPNNPFIFYRLVQSQESDMEFLVKTCQSLGYRVSTKGAHLHVYDPFKAVSRNMPYAELTTLADTVSNTKFAPGRVMEFDGTFGSNTPYGTSNEYVIETLDNDGQLIKHATASEGMGIGLTLPSRFTDSVPVSSISLDAVKKIGNAKIRNRVPFHANATVTGIPEVLVGSLVKLQKYDSKFDGFWMVSKVTHKVSRANYITELSLVKDSTNESEYVVSTGIPYVFPEDPVLDRGVWRSENSKVSTYV